MWTLTGIGEADKPFVDLLNLIAASEAVQLGLDPYAKAGNPLDPYNRPHGYSEWWMITATMGLTRADLSWLGPLLIGLMLAATQLVLRPASRPQAVGLLAMLVSPPLLFAINRLNHDVVVFLLMCAALACLRRLDAAGRSLGVVLLAVSAVLKYFPLAAAILLLEARSRRELVGWLLLYGCVLVLAWPGLEVGFRIANSQFLAPSWLYAFGAPVLFRNLDFAAATPLGWVIAGLLLLAGASAWWTSAARTAPPAEGDARTWEREYAAGAVMIVGCFMHGSSYTYKFLFALWLLPWLWRAAVEKPESLWRRATWFLLFAVLWFEGSIAVLLNLGLLTPFLSPEALQRVLAAALFIGQLLTWALIVCLWRGLLLYLGRQLLRLHHAPR